MCTCLNILEHTKSFFQFIRFVGDKNEFTNDKHVLIYYTYLSCLCILYVYNIQIKKQEYFAKCV